MKDTLNANAQAVLSAVQSVNTHPTALEVYELVKQKRPRIGLASIYRILGHLVEQGYIKELHLGEESARYDGRTLRHDHAICSNCGALLDLPIDVVLSQSALQQAAQAVHMQIDTHEVRIYGLCSSCQADQSSQQHKHTR